MEEIQENEYCRTDKGIIFKVDKEKKNLDIANFLDVEYGKIVSIQKNIIDLIEKDDYINGEKVIDIFNPEFLSFGELPYILTKNNKYEEQDIKTILTKEQYENNCYRIGE